MRPTTEALEATYSGPYPEAARKLLARAREYRACGDHAAAFMLEKDAAAIIRMDHTRRALAWDAARAAERKNQRG